jgi:hypothetical protein
LLSTVFRDAGRYTRQLGLFRPVPRVNLTPFEALIAASLRPLPANQQPSAASSRAAAGEEELLAEHPRPEQPAVPSLQSLATAVVGLHVDLYASACADIVSLLPGNVKAQLLTIARYAVFALLWKPVVDSCMLGPRSDAIGIGLLCFWLVHFCFAGGAGY